MDAARGLWFYCIVLAVFVGWVLDTWTELSPPTRPGQAEQESKKDAAIVWEEEPPYVAAEESIAVVYRVLCVFAGGESVPVPPEHGALPGGHLHKQRHGPRHRKVR